jgi:hypothetical protein
MRLSQDLIKQAILHPERDIRTEAVLYFSRSYTSDDSILPLAIEAIERYGWDNAFDVAAVITRLPLNDATLPWVLAQLHNEDVKMLDEFGWAARWDALNSLLSDADAELLARHKQAILDVGCAEADIVDLIVERIDLLTAGGEFCWEELEAFCVESKDIHDIGQVDLDHAYALCEAIGREKDKYAEKVLAILSEKIEDFESNPKVWMETFAVRIAGEMLLTSAIPLLIAKLKEGSEDGEWLCEQCETALIRIGGDATISAATEMFRQSDWHLRMVACSVLQHIHSDLAVTTALELLPTEKEETIRASLAGGLAQHLAFEAIDPLRQLVLDGTYDETYADLKRDVVLAATLMGVEFVEREQWKADVIIKRLERENKRLKQRLEEEVYRLKTKKKLERQKRQLIRRQIEQYGPEEEGMPTNRIGRNDPCPCGSGKKFKKCCLGRQRLGSDLI